MFLKQHSTDTIFSGLQAWYRGVQSVKDIAAGLGIGKSTLRDWINEFEYNSKNFGDEKYQERLTHFFGAHLNPQFLRSGQAVFSALKTLIGLDSEQPPRASRVKGNFFFELQRAFGSPLKVDGVDSLSLGIFRMGLDRMILDRGG